LKSLAEKKPSGNIGAMTPSEKEWFEASRK
jgi:hypothetical protein